MANRGVNSSDALYLYGVSARAEKNAPKVASAGIDGVHPVDAVACGEFRCWVSAVDHAAFGRELESNMENLDWLALHSVRHQQVVGELAQQTAIIPARFGTIFSGPEALRKDVAGRNAALKRVFKKIEGSDEWGVKVYAEQKSTAVAEAEGRSGSEYLKQKAARLKKRPDETALKEFADELGKVAADSAPTGKMSSGQPGLVWQATFLVPRTRRKQWEGVLQEFVQRWSGSRRIEVNGPWPAYSFVSDAE